MLTMATVQNAAKAATTVYNLHQGNQALNDDIVTSNVMYRLK